MKEAERVVLPDYDHFPDELLRQNIGSPSQYIDQILTSTLSGQKKLDYYDNKIYSDLLINNDNALINTAYDSENGAEGEIPQTSATKLKVYKVANQDKLDKLMDTAGRVSDDMKKLIDNRLNDVKAKGEYINFLAEEISKENKRHEEFKNKLKLELEKDQEKLKPVQEKVNNLKASLSIEPEEEMRAGLQQELEKAQVELEKVREEVRKDTEILKIRYKDWEKASEERLKKYEAMVSVDANPDVYEANKQKAAEFLAATAANHFKRSAEGYTEVYMATKTPLHLGMMAMAPVMDNGLEKDIVGKVAASHRLQFPLYDCIIATDKAEELLVDFWKDKEKGIANQETEKKMRRKLYDQVCRIEITLDQMYATAEDPEKDKLLTDLMFVDKSNGAIHMHEASNRGTNILRSSAQAYKVGIQQNWPLDDMATLALFNNTRRKHNIMAERGKKPEHTNDHYKQWVESMNSVWKELESVPLTNEKMRIEKLDRMHELIRDGYAREYVSESDALHFHVIYDRSQELTELIKEGKEPVNVETDNLALSEETQELMDSLKAANAMDFQNFSKIKEQKEQLERNYIEIQAGLLNKSFYGEEAAIEMGADQSRFSKSERVTNELGVFPTKKDRDLESRLNKFMTSRIGMESDEHKNLRIAATQLQDLTTEISAKPTLESMEEYINKLDEVIYRSRVYQEAKSGASSTAGKQRLEGAKELEEYAKKRLLQTCKKYSENTKLDYVDMARIRKLISNKKAENASDEITRLGMPKNEVEKTQIKEYAADIIVNNFCESDLKFNRKGFNLMGMNAIKQDILKSKEFSSVMKGYFDDPAMNTDKLLQDLADGKVGEKMNKTHKNMGGKFTQQEKIAQRNASRFPKAL